jgi:hypothetical protein
VTGTPERTDTTELADLYATYKQLTSAFAAAVITGGPDPDLRDAANTLHRRSTRAAAVHAEGPRGAPLQACAEAAAALCAALDEGSTPPTTETIDRLRALHRGLQRQVWDTMGCEYVPCQASGG